MKKSYSYKELSDALNMSFKMSNLIAYILNLLKSIDLDQSEYYIKLNAKYIIIIGLIMDLNNKLRLIEA